MPRNHRPAWRPAFLTRSLGAQAQEANGVFAVIAAIGAELVQDRLLILLARLAITFPNCFKVFPPGTLYHIKASFSVTFNMAQRYFLEYLSVTFNSAQFAQTTILEIIRIFATMKYSRFSC
jgi:hypothetical protein